MRIAPIKLMRESSRNIGLAFTTFLPKNFAEKITYKMSRQSLAISQVSNSKGNRKNMIAPLIIKSVSAKCGKIFNSFMARQSFPLNCIMPRTIKSPKLKNAQKTCKEINIITPK